MRVTCLPTHVIDKLLTTKSACMAEVIAAFVKRRNEIGMSQREISISIGVDDGLVSKWEIGNRRPSNFMMLPTLVFQQKEQHRYKPLNKTKCQMSLLTLMALKLP